MSLALPDSSRNSLAIVAQTGEAEAPTEIIVSSADLDIVIGQRQPIEITSDDETRFPYLVELAKKIGSRCLRMMPVGMETGALGILSLAHVLPGSFRQDDLVHANKAAQALALLLENALISDRLDQQTAHLATLLDVNTALISGVDIQKLFEEISASVQRMVRQDFTYLALYERPADAMKIRVLDSANCAALSLCENAVPIAESPAGIAFRQDGVMTFSEADLQAIGSRHTQQMLAAGIRSVSYLPLKSRGKKLGALGFASLTETVPAEDDVVLLAQIVAQLAIAVDNARAYEEIAKFKDRFSKEKLYLEDEINSEHNFGEVVGQSTALCRVLRQVEIAAPSDANVLLLGETGTGKELIARAVHRLSSRRSENFIKVNCAAIPTGLLESELFGHEKGAFTGAVSQKVGRLELADKGTLFLDEVGEIPMDLQPKLLRVLQDHEFERLGGVRTIRVNVRLVAATNRDLAQAVADREFRSDLYYRLNVFPIHIPPLRERVGDIPMLVRYFVQKFARLMSKRIESIPAELIQEFERWHWPGNIRELENFIERSVILTNGPVFFAPMAELRRSSPDRSSRFGTLEEVEREYILRTLRETGGIISGARGAAARLGMKRTTLQSRMQKLKIAREEYEV